MSENSHEINYKRTAYSLSSFYFLHFSTLGIVFPFAGYFFQQSGFSGKEIGMYLAIFPLVKFLLTNHWTGLFSRFRHKHLFFAACITMSSISMVMLAFTNNRILVGATMFVFATCRAGIIPVMDSLAMSIDRYVPYGRMRLFGSLGFVVTSTLGGILMDRFGIHAFVWVFMSAGLLSVLPSLTIDFSGEILKPTTREERKLTPELIFFLAGLMIYLTSFTFLSNFFNIKVAEAGYTQTWAGYMWSIGVVAEIFFLYNQELMLRLFSVRNLIALSMLLAGVRYLITGYTDSLLVLALFSTFNGFAFGTYQTGVMRYMRDYVPEKLKLKAQSLYAGVGYGMGAIVGSSLSGLIYDINGAKSVFTASFIFCVISAMIIYLFTCKKKPEQA